MKKVLIIVSVIAILLASCKKEDEPDPNSDKFASITVDAIQEAFVLLSTATWCFNCADWGNPSFHDSFSGSDGIDGGRVNGFALHYSNSDQYYTEMANVIRTDLSIDDTPGLWVEFDNSQSTNPDGWKSAIKARQGSPDAACGIGLLVEKNGNSIDVYAKVQFFNLLSGQYNLAIYVVEDGLVSEQSTSSGPDLNYVHNKVLRTEITDGTAWGFELFTGTSADEYHVTVNYIPSPELNINNLKFVAVVYEMGNGGQPVSSLNSNMN